MNYRRLVMAVVIIGGVGIGYCFKAVHAAKNTDLGSRPSFAPQQLEGKKNIIDIAILGSGPAGLTAALYGARLGYRTLIISGTEPGGQLMKTTYVENWPGSTKILGQKIIEDLKTQAQTFGAHYLNDTVQAVDFSSWPYALKTEEGRTVYAQTVIIATGATPKKLGVEGEHEYWGSGVTTCAVCDAPFYKGKEVVVVGGGDSALEEAMQLAAYASTITILIRGSQARASHAMKQHIKAIPSISCRYNVDVQKIIGDEQGVSAVELKNNKTGQIEIMPTSGVFLAIGHDPNTQLFKGVLALDDQGYIKLRNRSQESSIPGVFAAGDVEDRTYRQAGVAAGHGISAALDAANFLTEQGFTKAAGKKLEKKGAYFEGISPEKGEVSPLTSLEQFQTTVTKDSGVVVIDFYADYCPSCIQMLPSYDYCAAQLKERATFFKVDINHPTVKDLLHHLRVTRVPALLIFKHGELVATYNTTLSRTALCEAVDSFAGGI